MTLPKAIICDIDGTFANIDHRRHFVDCNLSDCCEQPIIEDETGMFLFGMLIIGSFYIGYFTWEFISTLKGKK